MSNDVKEIVNSELQNKYGFYYPCNKETYLKLKELHKAYWQALHDFYKWNRWNNKQPQNRKVEEPKLSKVFVVDRPWTRITTRYNYVNGVSLPYKYYRYFPKRVDDFDIVSLYMKARWPSKNPVEPFSYADRLKIHNLFEELKTNK